MPPAPFDPGEPGERLCLIQVFPGGEPGGWSRWVRFKGEQRRVTYTGIPVQDGLQFPHDGPADRNDGLKSALIEFGPPSDRVGPLVRVTLILPGCSEGLPHLIRRQKDIGGSQVNYRTDPASGMPDEHEHGPELSSVVYLIRDA